jgi:hypothetical protein
MEPGIYDPQTGGSTGIIFIRMWNQKQPSVEALSDVVLNSVADGEVLTYNSTSGIWENAATSGGGAPGPNPPAGSLFPYIGGTIGNIGLGSNAVFYNAIVIEKTTSFSHFIFRYNNSNASNNINIYGGIYSNDPDQDRPKTKLHEGLYVTTASEVGGTQIEIAMPVTLEPGVYWLYLYNDGASSGGAVSQAIQGTQANPHRIPFAEYYLDNQTVNRGSNYDFNFGGGLLPEDLTTLGSPVSRLTSYIRLYLRKA